MSKQSLLKFFTVYTVLYVFFIVLGIVFARTNLPEKNKLASSRVFTEKYAITEVMNPGQNQKQLASIINNDQTVQAGIADVFTGFIADRITGYVFEAHAPGLLDTYVVGAADNLAAYIQGGRITDCSEVIANTPIGSEIQDTETCKISEGSGVLREWGEGTNQELDEMNTSYNVEKGSFFAYLTGLSYSLHEQQENLVDTRLYAQDMIEQVPFTRGDQVQALSINSISNLTATRISLGNSIFNLWSASRNLTYYLIIIPTVAFGFAIMFRMQINAQTQVTLMRAIPRLLIAILLITFSFPLIALMVEVAAFLTNIGTGLLLSFIGEVVSGQVVDPLISGDIFEILSVASFPALMILVSFLLSGLFGAQKVAVIMGSVFLLIALIVWIRYIFTLFVTVVKLALLTGFGPLILLIGAFPGREDIIKNYFLAAAGHILGLSAIGLMVLVSIAIIFIGLTFGPFLALPMFFVGLGILWKAPSGPKFANEALGVQPLFGGGEQQRR